MTDRSLTSRSLVALLLACLAGVGPFSSAEAETAASESVEALPVSVELRTAALLLSDQQGGELPMVATAVRRPGASQGELDVWLTVELDPVGLRRALPDGGKVEAFLYLLDPRLEVHESLTAGWQVPAPPVKPASDDPAAEVPAAEAPSPEDPSAEGAQPPATAEQAPPADEPEAGPEDTEGEDLHPVRLVTRFTAPPPGDYLFRILVRADLSFGLRSLPLSVPVIEDVVPTLLEPVIAEPAEASGPWTRVRPAGLAAGEGTEPSAFAVLRRGAPLELDLTWTNPDGDPGAVQLELEREGETRRLPLTVRRVGSRALRTARGALPEDLAEGRYRLRLVSEGARPSMSSEIAVLDASQPAVRWTDLHRLAEREAGFGGEALKMPEGERRQVLATRAELFRVVADLERGLEPATARLRALENSLRETQGSEAVPFLHKQLVRVAGRLVRRTRKQPELRVSLIWLLAEHAEEHRRRGRYPLSQVFQKTTLEILRAMAEEEDQRSVAVDGLAVLAGRLQRRRFLGPSEELLQEALALDPDHPASLSALGAIYERSDRPKEASEVLGRLVELGPESGRDRVRLAVSLRRIGDFETASRELDRVIADDPGTGTAPWYFALAHQEKVRLEVDRGRLDAARQALRNGLARLPEDPVLRIAEPWLRSLAGERDAARETLLALPSAPDGRNARHRFHGWPRERLDRISRQMEERARAAAPELSALAREGVEDME